MHIEIQTPHRYIDVGHSRLAYYRFGQGPDVVFVHGWPLHSATWRHLVRRLADHFTCHLLDLPGAGRTQIGPDTPIGLVEHGETLRRAIEALGLVRYAFVSHDSGAVAARLVAADNPRVAGLVLGNTEVPGYRAWLVETYVHLFKVPGIAKLLGRLMKLRFVRHSPLGFGGCFAHPRNMEGEFTELFLNPLFNVPGALEAQARLFKNLDLSVVDRLDAVHARITAPTLLIWGAADRWFPLSAARRIVSQFAGGAELREIPHARLFVHEDHPDVFLAHAEPFLRRCLQKEAAA